MNTTSEPANPDSHRPPPGSTLPYFLAVAIMLVAAYGGWKWYQVEQARVARQQAIPVTPVGPPLTEFELTERSGKPFRSQDMRGRVWVVTYFFTTCPGSCIRLNTNIQALHRLPELQDVTWVSVTCDPDNDTLEVLSEYADRWQADPERWLFCRADLDYVKRVGLGMHLDVYRQGHKDYAVVIGKAGKIRGMYDATSTVQSQRLRNKLLECLAEDPPADATATQEQDSSSKPPVSLQPDQSPPSARRHASQATTPA